VINLLKELAKKEEILNNNIKIPPYNTPDCLKKKRRVTIRTRSFIIPNNEHRLPNVLI
jgi:hypothetical protein